MAAKQASRKQSKKWAPITLAMSSSTSKKSKARKVSASQVIEQPERSPFKTSFGQWITKSRQTVNKIDKLTAIIVFALIASLTIVGIQQYIGSQSFSADSYAAIQPTPIEVTPQPTQVAQASAQPTETAKPTATPKPTANPTATAKPATPAPTPTGTVITPDPHNSATTASNSYTVKSGDTLWSIAEGKYNSGFEWKKIAQANNIAAGQPLITGTVLTIPQASQSPTAVAQATPKATPAASQAPTASPASSVAPTQTASKTYTIAHGDTLWSIAEKQYGNGFLWKQIADANHLDNPQLIHAGNQLTIPPAKASP